MSLVTTLWVALGGAIGSVGRAWLALIVARATGPQFPWGTILINILGSFAISFFGTLTASADGRFAVSPDLRIFFMVGVCGGFTTFSSFSLQTLELARDGRPGQAAANVALSVVLCLTSVALGYYAAASLATGQMRTGAIDRRRAQSAQVVAILPGAEGVPGVLSAAAWLLAPHKGGEILAASLQPRPPAAAVPTEDVQSKTADAGRHAAAADPADVHAAADAWVVESGASRGVRLSWVEIEGPGGKLIAERGRDASAGVILNPLTSQDEDALDSLLFDAGVPVLLVPSRSPVSMRTGRVIAIAWRDDAHARKAVGVAAPWLRKAERVLLLQGGASALQQVPPEIAELHPGATVIAVSLDGSDLGGALLQVAHNAGADLLVMGAYGHGKLRERLFGGVTHTVLQRAELPMLLCHALS